MVYRFLADVTVCCVAVGAVSLSSAGQAGQDQAAPRTSWGHPDRRGTWTNATTTPMERPAEFEGREFLTEEERAVRNPGSGLSKEDMTALMPTGAYNDFWLDYGTNVIADRRTSLIVDPSDGRLPPLTAEGEGSRQIGSLWEDLPIVAPVRVRSAGTGSDHPEDRGLAERCLMGFNSGPPMMPSGYNNNMQLFQSADTVVIVNEMVHDARILSLIHI